MRDNLSGHSSLKAFTLKWKAMLTTTGAKVFLVARWCSTRTVTPP
ncbi:Uncharacterised protein [Vibrio cholerae]|nr:Uncharacterised protein [Vibrio cholerae]